MKRLKQLGIGIIIGLLFGVTCAHAQSTPEYREAIMQATLALETGEYPNALYYLKAAHFADRSRREPFELLKQIPPLDVNGRAFQLYYDSASKYYQQGDYRNARFFYQAAYYADSMAQDVKELLRHVDAVIAGRASPRSKPDIRRSTRESLPESRPKRADMGPGKRVVTGRYTVEPDREVEAILKKYEDPAERRQRERQDKIEAAMHDLARRQSHFSQTIKSQQLKQQAVAPLPVNGEQTPQYRKIYEEIFGEAPAPASVDKTATAAAETGGDTPVSRPRPRKSVPAKSKEQPRSSSQKDVIEVAQTIRLDDELWERQPGTILEIEFGKSLIFEGKRVQRFFMFDPEVSEAERRTEDEVVVTMLRRGTTLFHVWDDRGRWTFNLKGVLPISTTVSQQVRQDALEHHATPFRVSYSNNWNSFYLGDSPDQLKRMNLSFTQWVGIYGDTPYGFVDTSANFYRFADSTENTGLTLGLSNANLGPFEDFSIRGWDASKRFSDLSLPGRYFRGVLFDSYALDRRGQFSYLQGQDRAVFLQNSQGVTETRKSYIEGARIVLFPEEPLQVAFNYARGHGEERPDFLKDKIFSVEVQNRIGELDAHLEVAYDEEDFGTLLLTEYKNGDATLRVNLRDLQQGFTTITSRPSGSGEVGGNVIFDYRPDNYQLSTNLDVYRDREQENPADPDSINIDWGTVLSKPLGEGMAVTNSFFASHTPQLISPRTSLRWNSTLSKSFRAFHDRYISTFVTGSAQMSRYKQSPSSEYDRYGIGTGIRFPLVDRLNFFVNYTQSFVEVKQSGEHSQPRVMDTGLSYTQNFGSRISGRASVTYRDEENTDGRFSFLSGADTIRGNLGFSYRPTPEVEIFLDTSLRNVLTEGPNQPAFNDADVRVGMRASWDSVFRWDPTATVRGTVYKDHNRNSRQDPGEPGVPGIIVLLGHQPVTTGPQGTYSGRVRAKMVKVGLDFGSIPQGYSLDSYLQQDIDVRQGKTYVIDYGFITRSGIYGVFFEDRNGDGEFEAGEPTVAQARMVLDGKETVAADFEGVYQFYDVSPGKHILTIDVNTLPMEYLPRIKLKNAVEVQEGRTYTFHVPLQKNN